MITTTRLGDLSTKRRIVSLVLLVLLVLNMSLIFYFSAEGFDDTVNRSEQLAGTVVDIVDRYQQNQNQNKPMTEDQKEVAVEKMQFPVRKLAHFSEFMSLGGLACCLLLTLGLRPVWFASVAAGAFGLLYAVSDEVHQLFVDRRDGSFRDVMVDFAGVVCGVLAVVAIWALIRYAKRRRRYAV